MKRFWLLLLAAGLAPPAPAEACEPGLYRSPDGAARVALTKPVDRLRYTFVDGRRGEVGAPDSPLRCEQDRLLDAESPAMAWPRVPLTLTSTSFASHGISLRGVLVEDTSVATSSPLVVLVHGSERTSPMAGSYPYLLAALGLRVFAYDKRGTGLSAGEYTQNFELLADDAAAALAEAQRLAGGRYTQIGYFGGSQGGWVAPLAATRSPAQFVAVAFGLMASPVEEDRDQVLAELRTHGADAQALAEALEITDATAALVRSHFSEGYERLALVKRRYGKRSWLGAIKGEYTGDILSSSEAELRRVGRARFDNLELIWDYDAMATIRNLRTRQLWIIAEGDREAPPSATLDRLAALRRGGADLEIYSFPGTDHGMVEYTQNPDGSRAYGRITDGYFSLLADWISGRDKGAYGRARRR